jgi:predicted CXXCH cytochrome family protein
MLLITVLWCLASSFSRPARASGQAPAPAGGYVGTETCVTCHDDQGNRFKHTVMGQVFAQPRTRRAQLQRSSHMPFREGKVTCTSCHNPHGSAYPKQLIQATVNENCYSCHAERRGPFLWTRRLA